MTLSSLSPRAAMLASAILLWRAPTVAAQDLVKVEPTQATVILENERVRVLEVRVPVGAKQAMHSHPDHIVYPLTAYRVKHIFPDGRTFVGERQPGQVVWLAAEAHAGENVGSTEIRAVIVELKEPRHRP